MNLSAVVTCPNCKMRVFPKADGTCPSCQAIILLEENSSTSKSFESIENSETSTHLKQKPSPSSAPIKMFDGNQELTKTKKRTPVYYGASGCALGFIIMVIFVAATSLAGPKLPISGATFGTIVNVGSWVLPIGLGVLGYFYGKRKQ